MIRRHAIQANWHDDHLPAAFVTTADWRQRISNLDFSETESQGFNEIIAIQANCDWTALSFRSTKGRFREFVCPGCTAKEDKFTLWNELETNRMIDSVARQFRSDFNQFVQHICWNLDPGFEPRRIGQNLPPVRESSLDCLASKRPAVAANLDKGRLALVQLNSERPISVLGQFFPGEKPVIWNDYRCRDGNME